MSSDTVEDSSLFAETENEAIKRFEKFGKLDPFPDIQPALLNSADIVDYVAATGMIAPFYPGKVKSASYEIALEGKIILWDERNVKCSFVLEKGAQFKLPKNSIAYVSPEPTFRIPDYIALRFNLKITHVHRGILLGTGPLVDPGFEGKLFVPLHNLTYNDYVFTGGEDFIWVEFTKISSNTKRWTKSIGNVHPKRFGVYREFPQDKKYLEPEHFIAKALKDQSANTIRSSIPEVVREAEEKAERATVVATETERTVTDTIQRYRKYSLVGVAALIIALLGVFFAVFSLVCDATSYVKGSKDKYEQALREQALRVDTLVKEIDRLKATTGHAVVDEAGKATQPPKVAEPGPGIKGK